MSKEATDIIVKAGDPKRLDDVMKQLGAVVVQIDPTTYMQKDGGYVVRCFQNADFIKFAIKNQGYGEVLKTLDELV